MVKQKVNVTFEIEADQKTWLEEIVKKHGLADASKALRVLLDYARTEGDPEKIFDEIRCLRCG